MPSSLRLHHLLLAITTAARDGKSPVENWLAAGARP